MRGLRRGGATLAAALLLALAGCGTGSGSGTGSASAGGSEEQITLTVFAAASLTDTFTELGETFEADHAGTTVQFSFLGSSTLVDQLVGGAPADVLATANEAQMDRAVSEGVVEEPTVFTSNVLTIVVEPGNPLGITGLDSSLDGVKLVTCATEVPCGAATDELSGLRGVTLNPVSREQKVTDVLGKVTSGEADAGIVYVTDAVSVGDTVEEVPIPDTDRVINTYPIAVTSESAHPELAAEFMQLVLSDAGQTVLAEAGFTAP